MSFVISLLLAHHHTSCRHRPLDGARACEVGVAEQTDKLAHGNHAAADNGFDYSAAPEVLRITIGPAG